jgi:hypothetical protein
VSPIIWVCGTLFRIGVYEMRGPVQKEERHPVSVIMQGGMRRTSARNFFTHEQTIYFGTLYKHQNF